VEGGERERERRSDEPKILPALILSSNSAYETKLTL